jgi:hypothetical protein
MKKKLFKKPTLPNIPLTLWQNLSKDDQDIIRFGLPQFRPEAFSEFAWERMKGMWLPKHPRHLHPNMKTKTKTSKAVKKVSAPKTAIMEFHGFGLVSEETHKILKIEKDGTIVLETDCDESECKRFNPKTGECLNDTTFMGCYRTLKLPL